MALILVFQDIWIFDEYPMVFIKKHFINNINKANLITISPLEMKVTNKQGLTKKDFGSSTDSFNFKAK